MQSPELDNIEDYRKRFMDCHYWQPYVETVCLRHGINDSDFRIGIPGTYPVFIIEDKWVVKFFGRLFNGNKTFCAELDANLLVAKNRQILSPTLVAHGYLFDDKAEWRWPYLLFHFLPGKSLSEVRDSVSSAEKLIFAQKLGRTVRYIHLLPLNGAEFFEANWQNYIKMLEKNRVCCSARHKEWGDFPNHMLDQVDSFLLPTEKLIEQTKTPRLLHGDLTADHLIVRNSGLGWKFTALIDWGDAIVGDPLFELIPLHLDMFQCDKKLLAVFLDSYGFDVEFNHDMAVKMLNLCLLHTFNVFDGFFEQHPEAKLLSSLSGLAEWLWKI